MAKVVLIVAVIAAAVFLADAQYGGRGNGGIGGGGIGGGGIGGGGIGGGGIGGGGIGGGGIGGGGIGVRSGIPCARSLAGHWRDSAVRKEERCRCDPNQGNQRGKRQTNFRRGSGGGGRGVQFNNGLPFLLNWLNTGFNWRCRELGSQIDIGNFGFGGPGVENGGQDGAGAGVEGQEDGAGAGNGDELQVGNGGEIGEGVAGKEGEMEAEEGNATGTGGAGAGQNADANGNNGILEIIE